MEHAPAEPTFEALRENLVPLRLSRPAAAGYRYFSCWS